MRSFALCALALHLWALAPDVITGAVTYRERLALPAGAVLVATLEGPGGRVLSRTERPLAAAPPFRFQLGFDPAEIDATRDYEVVLRITHGGQTLLSAAPQAVLTQGHPKQLGNLMLSRPTRLEGTLWKLASVGGQTVSATSSAHLSLRPQEGQAEGSGGCNSFSGAYTHGQGKLSFGRMASTMRACLEGMETETAFQQALEATRGYRVLGSVLDLLDADGRVLARLQTAVPVI